MKQLAKPVKQSATHFANKVAGWGVVFTWAPAAIYALAQGEPTAAATYIIPTFCTFAGWAAAVGVDALRAIEERDRETQENAALDAYIVALNTRQVHAQQLEMFDR